MAFDRGLSDDYFDSLTRHAVPLNHMAVSALSGSAFALDVYAWLAQRLHRIPPSKPQIGLNRYAVLVLQPERLLTIVT
jgi:hypothetical protein